MSTIKRYESWRYYWKFFFFSILFFPALLSLLVNQSLILNTIGVVTGIVWSIHLWARLSIISSNKIMIDKEKLRIARGSTTSVVSIVDIIDISIQQSKEEKILGIGSMFINTKLHNPNCCIWRIKHPQQIKQRLMALRKNLCEKQTV